MTPSLLCRLVSGGAGLMALLWGSGAGAETIPGGHVGYGVGGALAEREAGLRHGLDLALVLGDVDTRGQIGLSAYCAGPSALIGFNGNPSYLGFDIGYGVLMIPFVGGFAGAGPVYRFSSDKLPQGYGLEGRIAANLYVADLGVRLMGLYGDNSSELATTVFLGVGFL